jgi:hypothetical protein
MTDLSPAAQAVLDACTDAPIHINWATRFAAAAVLRAAADQAHPKAHIEDIDYVHQSYVHGWKDVLDVILAIAAELDNTNNTR